MKKQSLKPELLNDILQETEELIKVFVTGIKTAVRQAHGPERSRRAEKRPRLGVIKCSVLIICFSFDVGRSMLNVRRSSLKTSPYGINATCENIYKIT